MKARRAGVPAVAAVIGALIATPALADVTVTPPSAVQGSGEDLTFHVTNTGARPVGSVTVKLPDDTPIAEVYPLSVDNWAPKIDTKKLATALPQEHGGVPTTQTASAITWLAMPGHVLAPGQTAELAIAVAPLPTLSSMQFMLSTKYSDGKDGPTVPPVTLQLTPPTAAEAAAADAAHAGHGDTTATGDTAATGDTTATDGSTTTDDSAEDATFAQAVAEAERGPSIASIAGWIIAALVLLGGGLIFILRGRHRAEEDDEPDDDEAAPPATAVAAAEEDSKEPTAAGDKEPATAGSKWSFKG